MPQSGHAAPNPSELARFSRLAQLLDSVLDLPPEAREPFIDQLGAEDDELKPRLRDLVRRSLERSPLDKPPEVSPLASPGTAEGDVVGPYRLLRRLGTGGMAAVFLAERVDGLMSRAVAVKRPLVAWRGSGLAERMARERQILGTLTHPHIARLYDAGIASDGQPYLALEYVDGRRIDEHCASAGLDTRARLELFLQVAHAVGYAHSKLVVHRDLKPANILVTAEGQVRLLDFGIAALLERGVAPTSPITELAGRALTPDYAAPEQISGEAITIQADVYSLGVVLHELLTGVRPPRQPEGSPEPPFASRQVNDPLVRRALRGDLDTVIAKALKRAPADRYQNVDALAADVRHFLAGEPVLAQPDSLTYRVRKLVGRHRLTFAAALAGLLALVTGSAVALWQGRVAIAEARRAEQEKNFLIAIFEDADPYAENGSALTARDLLRQARKRIDHLSEAGPALRVELLNTIGWSLLQHEDLAAAEEAIVTANRDARALDPSHPQVLRAGVLESIIHRYRGESTLARAQLDGLVPTLRRVGARSDLIRALRNRSNLALHEGLQAAALADAEEAVALSTEAAPAELISSLTVLTLARLNADEPESALASARRAFQLAIELHPQHTRHPRVIESRATLGRALARAGRHLDAIEALTQAVDDSVETFGPTALSVGFYLEPLARSLLAVGRIDEALVAARRSVAILAGHAKPDSYNVAMALHTRGLALRDSGLWREAALDLARAADIFERQLGPLHPTTLRSRAEAERLR